MLMVNMQLNMLHDVCTLHKSSVRCIKPVITVTQKCLYGERRFVMLRQSRQAKD